MKTLRVMVCMAMLVCFSSGQNEQPHRPAVPNTKTATEIAEAELIRVYGAGVKSERPFSAKLENGIWTVVGTRRCQENLPGGFVCFGGHWARVAKQDGRILGTGAQN